MCGSPRASGACGALRGAGCPGLALRSHPLASLPHTRACPLAPRLAPVVFNFSTPAAQLQRAAGYELLGIPQARRDPATRAQRPQGPRTFRRTRTPPVAPLISPSCLPPHANTHMHMNPTKHTPPPVRPQDFLYSYRDGIEAVTPADAAAAAAARLHPARQAAVVVADAASARPALEAAGFTVRPLVLGDD